MGTTPLASIWYEKYRPKSLEELVLPTTTFEALHHYITEQDVPHLLMYGAPGSGKTTIANILIDSIPCAALRLNASGKDRGIDVVRNEITRFAGSMRGRGIKFKIVFLDEADGISQDAQQALRNTIETYASSCRFILTANDVDKIHPAVRSRCTQFPLTSFSSDNALTYLMGIMVKEGIKNVQEDALKKVVKAYYPDIRTMVNSVQFASHSGEFDVKALSGSVVSPALIMQLYKAGDFVGIRKAVTEVTQFTPFYRALFDDLVDPANKNTQQAMEDGGYILTQHLGHEPRIPDREINFMTCILRLMSVAKITMKF